MNQPQIQTKVLPACKVYPTRTHHFAPASISPEKIIGVCMCGLAQDKPSTLSPVKHSVLVKHA